MIVEKAYAKINLALEVKEKQDDGYHAVNTIMVPINLYDELTFIEHDEVLYRSNIEIEDDIVLKALKLFYDKYNIKDGVCIILEKGIPLQAGLAGGSSDAAACLRGLNKFFGINAPLSELESLARILGSDVAYCLYQRASLCTGRGEMVELLDARYDKYPITIIKPDFGISTRSVYELYKWDKIDKTDKINNIIKGLKNNDINLVKENIFNDLSSVSIDMTSLSDIYNDIKDLGYKVYLSGSGPTLYIIDENPDLSKIKAKYDGISILNINLE